MRQARIKSRQQKFIPTYSTCLLGSNNTNCLKYLTLNPHFFLFIYYIFYFICLTGSGQLSNQFGSCKQSFSYEYIDVWYAKCFFCLLRQLYCCRWMSQYLTCFYMTKGSQKVYAKQKVRTDLQDPSGRMHAYLQVKPSRNLESTGGLNSIRQDKLSRQTGPLISINRDPLLRVFHM